MTKRNIIAVFFFAAIFSLNSVFANPPEWSKNAIWYQIFVERFNNGDPANDPTVETTSVENMKIFPPRGWKISSWTDNWFLRQPWEQDTAQSFNSILQYRRYGGDLQGVFDKLDYLQELGVNAIYFDPLNDAPSLHKYDARNYHHIDVNFGPDPEGDRKIINSEIPEDPSTWKWTSADKLFLRLVDEFHKRGIKVIIDYSWNHTGTDFWAWKDVLKNQENSRFKDWYEITSFDNPKTPDNEFSYKGWADLAYLPEIKKVDITTRRISGFPYEGNINEGFKKHIFDVTRRWLQPDNDISKGIDGFRLDVADQIGLGFWREYYSFVKNINPNAYLVGEIWWEKWPDNLMNPAPYVEEKIFDAVMFYQVYKPARNFFVKTEVEIDAKQLKKELESEWNRLPEENLYGMMNVSSSHDAPRLLSDFYNSNPYKYHANPQENTSYKTGKPNKEAYKRLRLYLTHVFTTVGAPHIWNGEEMGMWGADDPNCRKPLMWKGMKFDKEYRYNYQPGKKSFDKVKFNQSHFDFYKKLIRIRKENPVLSLGEFHFMENEGKKWSYTRSNGVDSIVVLFNLESKSQNFSVPPGKYIDLLTNKKVKVKRGVKLKKLQAKVIKKIKG